MRSERIALAGLYRELASLARQPPATRSGRRWAPSSPPSVELYGFGHDHGPSVEAYRVLLDEAERIRGELIVLAGQAEQLDPGGNGRG